MDGRNVKSGDYYLFVSFSVIRAGLEACHGNKLANQIDSGECEDDEWWFSTG